VIRFYCPEVAEISNDPSVEKTIGSIISINNVPAKEYLT